jgi:nitrite reductase/ring-hydroxylating ferredoxin subunit
MNKTFIIFFIVFGLISCDPDDGIRNNPYLNEVSFRLNINLNLPEYNNLNFPGNSYVSYNHGINGVVVYNINNNQYTAFELSDPNHQLTSCSRLTVQGIIATCSCGDGNSYNILTGELSSGTGQYSLKPYRVRKSGNMIEVYN